MTSFKYLSLILIALFFTSCTSFKGNTGKVKKDINIEEIKREGLTTVTNTFNEGPNIGYNNAIKPRREMSSSSSKISFPNFPISIKFQNFYTTRQKTRFGSATLFQKMCGISRGGNLKAPRLRTGVGGINT